MTLSPTVILTVGGLYLGGLFLIAFVTDRLARRGRAGFINSPLIYTLSLAIYCTSWTFYGAVGSAVRNGLEFATIYLGPTLVFMGWWLILRRLVRVARSQRTTSIADFLSSRYGKSAAVSALVTIAAVVSITPYIALQLKAVATSFDTLAAHDAYEGLVPIPANAFADTGLWTAVAMAAFVILFGTRNLSADESHPGVIAAIAFESVVKLLALSAVGLFVIFGLKGGIGAVFADGEWNASVRQMTTLPDASATRWVAITFLSAVAIVCLPRQFQVAIVENRDERHLVTASWLFPLYLLLISLFVVPIAIGGMTRLPEATNPDLYVLTLPLAGGQELLALFVFIGGLSAATSMVIVSSIALSIMISNHLLAPILLRLPFAATTRPEGLTPALLMMRRFAILVILTLGYLYYRGAATGGSLAAIGLISFAGVAQFMPALIGGMFWRSATRVGALSGLSVGFVVWFVTMFLPSFLASGQEFAPLVALRTLLVPAGSGPVDPLIFGLAVSLGANAVCYLLVSLISEAGPIERLQSALFVDILHRPDASLAPALPHSAHARDLYLLTERILGAERAAAIFAQEDEGGGAAIAAPRLVAHVERQLGTAIGAASARLLVSRIAKGEPVGIEAAIELLDETREVIRYSRALEQKSRELEETAAQLREANEQLKQMDRLKDDFLSQVSHEMRTPMTAIRSFAQLLAEERDLDSERARRFIDIIEIESARMTRVLDEILDLKRMESGQIDLLPEVIDLKRVLRSSLDAISGLAETGDVTLHADYDDAPVLVEADPDRLKQVFINLVSNSIKFMDGGTRNVRITVAADKREAKVFVADTGPGIAESVRGSLFTVFARGWDQRAGRAKGSGLGLAISKQIVTGHGGTIGLAESSAAGSTFVVTLPRALADRAARKQAAE